MEDEKGGTRKVSEAKKKKERERARLVQLNDRRGAHVNPSFLNLTTSLRC